MMNTKRILVGGLLAATIIVVAEMLLYSGVLADAMAAAQAQKGVKPEASWGGPLYLGDHDPSGTPARMALRRDPTTVRAWSGNGAQGGWVPLGRNLARLLRLAGPRRRRRVPSD